VASVQIKFRLIRGTHLICGKMVNDYGNSKKGNSHKTQRSTNYTLSEDWSGVNWADLLAAQGAFGTDFYDRSILRPKHRAYYRSGSFFSIFLYKIDIFYFDIVR